MPLVVGVRFRCARKIYDFECEDMPDLYVGDYVVVKTERGKDIGVVVKGPTPRNIERSSLEPVLRRATPQDISLMNLWRSREAAALKRGKEFVQKHELPMKLLKAEYNYDGSRLMFYFTAEGRVDFRGLVRTLARAFRTRIDLHQVGVRDDAKLVGDLGVCGRLLCCRDWLTSFHKVSIRMAKHQDLSLSPMEISGACGRLLCCLAYEDDYYVQMKKIMPKKGDTVHTPHGTGVVRDVNVVTERVSVSLEDERIMQLSVDEIEPVSPRTRAGLPSRR